MIRAALSAIWRRFNPEPQPLPFPLERRMASLGITARKGGKGSDLAAAELRGMQTVILAVRATSFGWRGQAVNRG